MHVDVSLPTSMAMSVMTNSIYGSCDVWKSFNKMAAYNIRQDTQLYEIKHSHEIVTKLWKDTFRFVKQNTDLYKMIR